MSEGGNVVEGTTTGNITTAPLVFNGWPNSWVSDQEIQIREKAVEATIKCVGDSDIDFPDFAYLLEYFYKFYKTGETTPGPGVTPLYGVTEEGEF